MIIRPVGAELFHVDRWLDRHDKVRCCFNSFSNGQKPYDIKPFYEIKLQVLKTMKTVQDRSSLGKSFAFEFRILPLSYPNFKH